MAGSRLAIGQAFRVEKIGEETIVFNRSSGETIHRVSGNAAEALRLIADGVDETDVPAQFRPAVDELVAAGVVEGSRVWSRRQALATGGKGIAAAGSVWPAATVSTFALADPAAAATPCSGITPSPAQVKYTTSGTYTTGRGVTTLQVRVWGGGGGGGARDLEEGAAHMRILPTSRSPRVPLTPSWSVQVAPVVPEGRTVQLEVIPTLAPQQP